MISKGRVKVESAKNELIRKLPVKQIRKIKKYKNITKEQYLNLINKLERIALLLLDSTVFNKKQ